MLWDTSDNKEYVENLDRTLDKIYISSTESWEVNHFIKHFLVTHGKSDNDANRAIVGKLMERYPRHAPWKGANLTAFIEQFYW